MVLSDGGAWFPAFCNANGLQNVLCHRHLLENLGARSLLATLVKPLLDADTSEGLAEAMEQLNIELEKVTRLTGFIYNRDPQNLERVGFTPNAEELQARWSLPARGNIERANNHSEGFHGKVNNKTSNIHTLGRRILIIAHLIEKSAKSFVRRIGGESVRKRMVELSAFSKGEPLENCRSWQARRHAALYGCEPFCVHTCCGLDRKNVVVRLDHHVPAELLEGPTTEIEGEAAQSGWNRYNQQETVHTLGHRPGLSSEIGNEGPAIEQLIMDISYLTRLGYAGAGRAMSLSFEILQASPSCYESGSPEYRAEVKCQIFSLLEDGDDINSLLIVRDHILCIRERTELLEEAVALSTELRQARLPVPHFTLLVQMLTEDTTISTLKCFKQLEERALAELDQYVQCHMLKKQAVESVIKLLADKT